MKRPDYYSLLHTSPSANLAEIKACYRRLMQKVHPDQGGCADTAARLNEAYSVLSDPDRRARYDLLLRRARAVSGHQPQYQQANKYATPKRPATKQPPRKKQIDSENCRCLFCKAVNVVAVKKPTAEALHCRNCKSPLRFIDFDPEWLGERAHRNVKHDLQLQFRLNNGSARSYSGKVIDLSPSGMKFLTQHRLQMGNIIKIDNRELTGVASVMRCTNQRGRYEVGVKFLSLKIHRQQGTFISHKV